MMDDSAPKYERILLLTLIEFDFKCKNDFIDFSSLFNSIDNQSTVPVSLIKVKYVFVKVTNYFILAYM